MLVSSNVLGLRCWFRMTLTVNRFELRNRNRPTIPIILCTTNNHFGRGLKSSNYDRSKYTAGGRRAGLSSEPVNACDFFITMSTAR